MYGNQKGQFTTFASWKKTDLPAFVFGHPEARQARNQAFLGVELLLLYGAYGTINHSQNSSSCKFVYELALLKRFFDVQMTIYRTYITWKTEFPSTLTDVTGVPSLTPRNQLLWTESSLMIGCWMMGGNWNAKCVVTHLLRLQQLQYLWIQNGGPHFTSISFIDATNIIPSWDFYFQAFCAAVIPTLSKWNVISLLLMFDRMLSRLGQNTLTNGMTMVTF